MLCCSRLLLLTWLSVATTMANMSCLVMRPGYGLVSEDCPSHAVGCRIRAKKDHIEWYELSRLYDRNQLVCVYPEEYKSMTGCMRKPSGSIRCWCGGRPNCNDPETSRDLYEAFTEGDMDAVEKISVWLTSQKDESSWKKFTTTEETPTTTTPKKSTWRRKSTTTTTTTTTSTTTTPRPTTTTESATSTSTVTPKKTTKRIGNLKTTTTQKPSKLRVINIVDIREKGVPLPNDDISLGDTFEETRKKLEKEMREEDERLREMLADEEEENDVDEEDENEDDMTAEDQREEERERYRMERRRAEERRLQEDTILRRMEEEEIRVAAKDTRPHRGTPDDDEGIENSSSTMFGRIALVIAVVVFISLF